MRWFGGGVWGGIKAALESLNLRVQVADLAAQFLGQFACAGGVLFAEGEGFLNACETRFEIAGVWMTCRHVLVRSTTISSAPC